MSETTAVATGKHVAEYLSDVVQTRVRVKRVLPALCPVYVADAPWRVNPGTDVIPLTFIARDAVKERLDRIEVYMCDHVGMEKCLANGCPPRIFPGPGKIKQKYWYYKAEGGKPDAAIEIPAEFKEGAAPGKRLHFKAVFWKDNEASPIQEQHLEVLVASDVLPAGDSPQWCYGDTHYHSSYTNDIKEFGNPVSATKEAGRSIGLEWLITTDHSVDFNRKNPFWEEVGYHDPWSALGHKVEGFSDDSFRLVRGEEVSVVGETEVLAIDQRHLLVFGDRFEKRIPGAFFEVRLRELWKDLFKIRPLAPQDELEAAREVLPERRGALRQLSGYLARFGEALGRLLRTVTMFPWLIRQVGYLFGRIYTLRAVLTGKDAAGAPVKALKDCSVKVQGALAFAAHPRAVAAEELQGFLKVGWNDDDLNQPLNGLEAWNARIRRRSINKLNPFGAWQPDNGREQEKRAIELWDACLQRKADQGEWGFVLVGGSDAHGCFNYNAGKAWFFSETERGSADDNCLGKVRTLLYLPERSTEGASKAPSEKEIMSAIEAGSCVVTDGPVLNFTVDANGQHARLGQVLGPIPGNSTLDVKIQATSTQEFGRVKQVTVFYHFQNHVTDSFKVDYASKATEAKELSLHPGFGYVRLEAETEIDVPDIGTETFRCVTNPIWI